MKTHIELDIEDNELFICEDNCTGELYNVSGNWPSIIDDICGCLHDYLEGMDIEERLRK